jgi:hypothetical protein
MRSHAKKTVMNHVKVIKNMVAALHNGERYNTERLEFMKTLCNDIEDTLLYALFLAAKVNARLEANPSLSPNVALIKQSFEMLEEYVHGKTIGSEDMMNLKITVAKLEACQDLYVPRNGERIRIVKDWFALVLESCMNCIIYPKESTIRGYQATKSYCEVSIADRGKGLLIESADKLADVAEFWEEHYKHHTDEVINQLTGLSL